MYSLCNQRISLLLFIWVIVSLIFLFTAFSNCKALECFVSPFLIFCFNVCCFFCFFIFLSRRFHGDLINSLLSGKNGLKVFKDGQLNEYSKLIISFLCGHYQMPAKFNKYNDPTDFFHNAINKNNSRFLTWFGIRYYIDLGL